MLYLSFSSVHRSSISLICTLSLAIEFNEEQRTVFCVFSGDGVSRLRRYLNEDHFESEVTMYEEGEILGDDGDADGILGLMQSTGLDAEDGDGDGDDFDVEMQ